MKIVLYISGGVLQDIYATDPNALNVVCVDDDNLADQFNRDERESILSNETEGLRSVFVDLPEAQKAAIARAERGGQ